MWAASAPAAASAGHPARNRVPLSDHLLTKRVRVGYKGLAHAIEYHVTFTLPEGEWYRAQQFLEQFMGRLGASDVRVSGGLAKVSLVGIGLRSDPGIAARLCHGLTQQGITVSGLSVNELRISCLVNASMADQAVRILHDTFELAGETPVEPVASSSPL